MFQIESADYWERDFRWDVSSDPREFYVRIYANKGMDARSRALCEVIIQGFQPSDPEKEGSVTILINAKLITTFDRETAFQKTPFYHFLIWVYMKLFYNRVRRGYLRLCERLVNELHRNFRSLLNV